MNMILLQVQSSDASLGLLHQIFGGASLAEVVDDLTTYMVAIASVLVPLFYGLSAAWSYAKHTISNVGDKPKFFEKMDLIRGGLLWFMIIAYQPIFGGIEAICYELIAKTEPADYQSWKANQGAITISALSKDITEPDTLNGEEEQENPSDQDDKKIAESESTGMLDGIKRLVILVSNIGPSFTHGFFSLLGYMASIVVSGLSYIIGKVFYIIGPLVICFSVLPNFKDKLDKWFGTWLSVNLNMMVVNLLTTMLIAVSMDDFKSMSSTVTGGSMEGAFGPSFGLLIFNVIVTFLYLLSFWVTSFIVGSADAGKVLSTASSLATTAVTSGMLKMGGGALGGEGTGGADPIKNIVESAKVK